MYMRCCDNPPVPSLPLSLSPSLPPLVLTATPQHSAQVCRAVKCFHEVGGSVTSSLTPSLSLILLFRSLLGLYWDLLYDFASQLRTAQQLRWHSLLVRGVLTMFYTLTLAIPPFTPTVHTHINAPHRAWVPNRGSHTAGCAAQAVDAGRLLMLPFTTLFQYLQVSG